MSPESIPDNIAWIMLFHVLADRPGAPDHESRSLFLNGSGLSDVERNRVIFAASDAAERIRAMEKEVKKSGRSMDEMTLALRGGRDAIVSETVTDLLTRQFDYDGGEKLLRYLRTGVKQGIRMSR
ncbi:MAG: hypothetical protein KIT09_03430 [Bryobacteraceae bacterium]|nr:hypothetical protein [Bryobacteraceae bacterium]